MSENTSEPPVENVNDDIQSAGAPEAVEPVTLPVPKPESAFRRFLRRVVRWTLFILVIFGLGMVAAVFLWYIPMRKIANANLDALNTANQQVMDLKEQLAGQTALEKEYQTALERLKLAAILKLVQSLQVEVASARIALYQNNIEAAQNALENADKLMTELQRQAEKEQQDVITDLQTRLTLAKSEIKDNSYAAQSDLDVLWRGLNDLFIALESETP